MSGSDNPGSFKIDSTFFKANPLAYIATAYTGSAMLQKGIGFVLFLWLAHSLSVQDYATFGLLYALQTGLSTMAIAGIIESVIGLLKDHESSSSRHSLFRAANSVFGLFALASIVIVAAIYCFLLRETSGSAISLVCVIITGVVTAFFSLQAYLVRLEERHLASLMLGFLSPMSGLIGGAIGFMTARSVHSFYVGSAIGLVLSSVPFALFRIGFYRMAGASEDIMPIVARIAPFIIIAALGWLGGYGNTYLVKTFFAGVDVAKFTFLYTLSAVLQLVATSLNQVWSPKFFRIVHEMPLSEVEAKNKRFYAIEGLTLGLVGGLLLLVLPFFLRRIGGNLSGYQGMNLELFFLFMAYAWSIPFWHVQNYYYAYKKGKELMRVTLFGSGLGLILWLIAIVVLGRMGIYVGFMIQMMTRMLGAVALARKEWALSIAWEGVVAATFLLLCGAAISSAIY